MKAAQLVSPKKFKFLDVDVPKLQDGQCLIKMEKLSICGSDIYLEYNETAEEKYPMPVGVPCHECAGTVVESRTDAIKEGQRVIVLPQRASGLQQYVAATPGQIIPLPDWGPLDEWVMCQPSGTVLYSVSRMGNLLGRSALVLGQGAIGLSFTMILERQGLSQLIVADPHDYRLEKAKEFGATDTINPSKVNIDEAVAELTKGQGPDYVVDASGDPEGLNEALRLVKHRGTVVGFSLVTPEKVQIEHLKWMLKEASIIPTTSARSGDPLWGIKAMVALKARGWADPGRLVSHRMSWRDVQKAFDLYEGHKGNIIKVVMTVD